MIRLKVLGGNAMKDNNVITKKENLLNTLSSILSDVYGRVSSINAEEKDENQEFINLVDKAHSEWRAAEQFFENVSDPDLIDHAIYKMEAAKSRYRYLLKKAKEEGIKGNFN